MSEHRVTRTDGVQEEVHLLWFGCIFALLLAARHINQLDTGLSL